MPFPLGQSQGALITETLYPSRDWQSITPTRYTGRTGCGVREGEVLQKETLASLPGLSCPRRVKGGLSCLAILCAGITKHVESDAGGKVFLGSHAVDRFLHLAVSAITALYRMRG
jgi:hypothetical protein